MMRYRLRVRWFVVLCYFTVAAQVHFISALARLSSVEELFAQMLCASAVWLAVVR